MSKKELLDAKEQLYGHMELSLDGDMVLMFNLGKSVMIHGKVDSIQEIYHQIDSIDLQEICNAAKDSFRPEKMAELIYEFQR